LTDLPPPPQFDDSATRPARPPAGNWVCFVQLVQEKAGGPRGEGRGKSPRLRANWLCFSAPTASRIRRNPGTRKNLAPIWAAADWVCFAR
jgi:hypothetical protein